MCDAFFKNNRQNCSWFSWTYEKSQMQNFLNKKILSKSDVSLNMKTKKKSDQKKEWFIVSGAHGSRVVYLAVSWWLNWSQFSFTWRWENSRGGGAKTVNDVRVWSAEGRVSYVKVIWWSDGDSKERERREKLLLVFECCIWNENGDCLDQKYCLKMQMF